MTDEDFHKLVKLLKSRPGEAYITSDGKTLFSIVEPGDKIFYVTLGTGNFNDMDSEEINQVITKLLSN